MRKTGSYVLNATKDKKERVGRILQMHANKRMELDKVYSVDIAATSDSFTTTGDTVCGEQHPVILESMSSQEPVIGSLSSLRQKLDRANLVRHLLAC